MKTVDKQLGLLERQRKVREELVGLEDLKMYDVYRAVVKDVKFEMRYEEGKCWMLKGVEGMGEEQLKVVKEGVDKGWVDVYENKGKG